MRRRRAPPAWIRGVAIAAAPWLALAAPLGAAQAVTGKIQGRVTEAGTGRAVAGAEVRVVGTHLRNLTDADGFYFLTNVPAGSLNVRAEFIGYRTAVVEAERILAGQTTTLDFALEPTRIELEPIRVEGERTPLVPRDRTVSKSIVRGVDVDRLPIDRTEEIVRLQPGVSAVNCINRFGFPDTCPTLRGGRPNEEVVYLDGVSVRAFGTGAAGELSVPTNALEQVDVTVGAFGAEFGGGQSGVVSYVTRRGGSRLAGSLEYTADRLAPDSWRTGLDRLEATLGGPLAGPLSFFVAGTTTGQPAVVNAGSPDIWVIDGVDTCPDEPRYEGLCTPGEPAAFTVPSAPGEGAESSEVEVVAPRFVRWEAGRTFPLNWRDETLLTGNLNLDLPAGRLGLSYTRSREQAYGRSAGVVRFSQLYRTDRTEGRHATRSALTAGGFLILSRSARQQLSLDLRASYQRDRLKSGVVDPEWFLENRGSFAGFPQGDVRFLVDRLGFRPFGFDAFEPSDELINVVRSGAVPADSLTALPGRTDLTLAAPGLAGVSEALRLNPYGVSDLLLGGLGFAGLRASREDRWLLRGALDWQIGRFNRLKVGGEYATAELRETDVPLLALGGAVLPERGEPIRAGAFLQNRLDLGDLVVEGGLRWDFLDPRVEFPRVPGFVSNVPDSLKAGFVRAVFGEPTRFVPAFEEPCGGISERNPNGTCLSNFIGSRTKSEISPRIGVSFPVTATSTFRLSFGRFVQSPAFLTRAASGQAGLLHNNNLDEQAGNPAGTFARDVDLPSTRTFEFGYRQLIGSGLVVDAAAFHKRQRNGLTFRQSAFADPNVPGRAVFRNVLTNADFSETSGFELKVDRAIGNVFLGSVSYSHLSARGSGSDPFTFVNFLLEGARNLSAITGLPPDPPNLLIRLDQSRRHNITLTSSLQLPGDLRSGSVAAALFGDLGLFMTLALRSGIPFTRVENSGRGQLGPPATFSGDPASGINRLETPWTKSLDLRVTKGVRVAGARVQLIADLRNPFGFSNVRRVFLETGSPVNRLFRENFILADLTDATLDGDAEVDGFDIRAEAIGSDLNQFMLLRAEERFGNGDGFYSVEEQRKASGELYEAVFGRAQLVDSDRSLRLGVRISF